jgi:hypothetical protein
MVDNHVSLKCIGCICYNEDILRCGIRDEAIQALNEDAEYERLGLDDYS